MPNSRILFALATFIMSGMMVACGGSSSFSAPASPGPAPVTPSEPTNPQPPQSDPTIELLDDFEEIDPSLLPLTLTPLAPVVSRPAEVAADNQPPYFEYLTDMIVYAGTEINLLIAPIDPEGDIPGQFTSALPVPSSYPDNYDGTRSFLWRPLQPDVGVHTITFTAVDPMVPLYRTSQTIRIQVLLPDDPSMIINLPPALDDVLQHTVRTGDTIVLLVKAVDPNGTFGPITALNLPPGAIFTPHPDPKKQDTHIMRWPTTASDFGLVELRFRAFDAIDSTLSDDNSVLINIADPDDFVTPGQPLRELANARGIQFGYASLLGWTERPDADLYADKARQEFDLVTTENSMKWGWVHPEPDEWRWEDADNLVAFARANDIGVHGHPLVWHRLLPRWVQRMPADERQIAMLGFIRTVVNRYNNDVSMWDVVNEAFEEDGSFRQSVWFEAMGVEYIEKAFVQARIYAPAAELLYNDFDVAWINPKSNAMYSLIQDLVTRGVPVDGVGFQMHLNADFNDFASVGRNFQRFADLGLDIYITELDVGINAGQSEADQARVYGEVVAVCLDQPRCKAIQTWGFTDRYSWRRSETPLMFDEDYQPKPAYFALQQQLLGVIDN